jgi:hypothetical protein
MTRWRRLTIGRRVLLGVLIVCLVGDAGLLIWGWSPFPFILVGFVAVVVNFA